MKKTVACFLSAVFLTVSAMAQYAAPTMSPAQTPPKAPSTLTANLPTCNTATTGWVYAVTDALLPSIGGVVVGGGAITVLVRCNGTSWLVGQ